jgi:ABC-2 type transport system permease protein
MNMKCLYFASRNRKEIIRDPLASIFGIIMPIVLILLFSLIANASTEVPAEVVEMFNPIIITPGLTIFGISFITMFLGGLIAKDKSSSFLSRLFVSPLKPKDFIFGYIIPTIPIAFLIAICCTVAGIAIGMPISINILFVFLSYIPYIFFASVVGVFIGTIANESQVLVFGNLFVIGGAFLGGMWMNITALGGTFMAISVSLPFYHAVEASRLALSGEFAGIWQHLGVVIIYALVFFVLTVIFFNRKMKSDNK